MTWASLVLVFGSVAVIAAGQIYLRLRPCGALWRGRIERGVLVCAALGACGYGLMALSCVESSRCFAPQRALAIVSQR